MKSPFYDAVPSAEMDAIFETEPSQRALVVDYFLEEFLPQFLETLDKLLHSGQGKYLAGDEVNNQDTPE